MKTQKKTMEFSKYSIMELNDLQLLNVSGGTSSLHDYGDSTLLANPNGPAN